LTPDTVLETAPPPEVGTEIRASFKSDRLEQKNGFKEGFGVEPTLKMN
jgi:hypothetical protein